MSSEVKTLYTAYFSGVKEGNLFSANFRKFSKLEIKPSLSKKATSNDSVHSSCTTRSPTGSESSLSSTGSNKSFKNGTTTEIVNVKERIKEEKRIAMRQSFPHNAVDKFYIPPKTKSFLSPPKSAMSITAKPIVSKPLMNDAMTQTIDLSSSEVAFQTSRSLQTQVESLESLLRESAQYITQLSEQVSKS